MGYQKTACRPKAEEVSPEVLDEAIAWYVKLGSGTAQERLHDRCQKWRASDPACERAWRQVQSLDEDFKIGRASCRVRV